MTAATAEKQTCKYIIDSGYVKTTCGEFEFADVTKHYTYCPDCGKKIRRVEKSERL